MKFFFNADMMILQGVSLSTDYRKFVLRGEGRMLTFHNSAAIVERVRVPHMQRSILYNPFTAELLSCGVSSEIIRINLETGAFVESYQTGLEVEDPEDDAIFSMGVFSKGPATGVVMLAGGDGCVEAWDSRSASKAGRLSVVQTTDYGGSASGRYLNQGKELRHVSIDDDSNGLLFCCGDENGKVYVYDVRLQKPLLVKDHMNSLPIVKTYFFKGKNNINGEANQFIVSADTRSVKIWDKNTGKNFTSVDSPAEVYDFMFLRREHNIAAPPFESDDSGVLTFCCDTPKVQVHFIPQLAPAPRWASFLDVIADDLHHTGASGAAGETGAAESEHVVYNDYTFISLEKMKELGISANDMADGKIRPVMHGAFIENNLFRDLQAVLNPTAFDKSADANRRRKTKERWDDRISKFKRVEGEEEGEGKTPLAAAKEDPRFAKQLGNRDSLYALDSKNPEYKRLLQTIAERRAKATERRKKYESDLFTIVPDAGGEEDGEDTEGRPRDEAREQLRGVQSSGKFNPRKGKKEKPTGGKQDSKVTMFEVQQDSGNVFVQSEKHIHHQRKQKRAENLTLEERLKKMKRQ
ncbi:ribosome biogenesis protein ENP2 [Angomonas deanei]|uniref:NUC153 domain-containing protein n=1 Tax=Angomonas deanei TaxID=59799 RepID=A0A7G2C622_9TRYP|nr:ribosome biogenesis protein ENP2 [Angomonas deanei]CAD2215049.1 hypothetical protein, conserved [Angomonas deanei]|eukprot:EPY24305.1 ribosome biogenesis protein ENP2 [Angomonas deanei]